MASSGWILPDSPRLSPGVVAVTFAAFLGGALYVYQPTLHGRFASDDVRYVVQNPYVQTLSVENAKAILDPFGPTITWAGNYAPVHLFVHALQVRGFGSDTTGYHAVNVVLHATTAVLLVALLCSSKIPFWGALVGGLIFLFHPANVEAVALIFEVKTVLSTLLALVALLAFGRLPGLAALLFGLALLTKISAAFALPVAMVLAWVRSAGDEPRPPRWGWLGVWGLVLLAVAIPEYAAFRRHGEQASAAVTGVWVQGQTWFAIAMRYLVMALSGYGVSALQQPAPATSATDPWWLGGVVCLGLLGWRAISSLRRRREEAAYWVMAAAAYAPVSQIFPFTYPMADRYLYSALPGLIGAGLLAGPDLGAAAKRRLGGVTGGGWNAPWARAAPLIVGLAVALLFAGMSHRRGWVFVSDAGMRRESAANFPHGYQANLLRVEEAARAGDADATAVALRALYDAGFMGFMDFLDTPVLARVIHDEQVERVLHDMAGWWIERGWDPEWPSQIDLQMIAQAHAVRGETREAIEALEQALALGGPMDAFIRSYLAQLREREAQTP